MTAAFQSFVPGSPEPQGSARGFYNARMKRVIITSDNPRLKNWRKVMTQQFALDARLAGLTQPIDAPVRTSLVLILPRLKGHPKTKDGNRWPDRGFDADKLERAVNDSLVAAGVIADDSRICLTQRVKRYAALTDTAGVQVSVAAIDGYYERWNGDGI